MKTNLLTLLFLFCGLSAIHSEVHQPEFSTAGFFVLPNTGREVLSMNPAWLLCKGAATGAEKEDFDDTKWKKVNLPDGLEYLPTEASGGVNYQGEAWYRKHFVPANKLKGKKLTLYFEAIMGKSKIWINGQLVKERFGGYHPIIIDATKYLRFGKDNVIAVWADNSNDGTYPPGKPQETLDFSYFGGIYRDCWLVAHAPLYITDENAANLTADGGLFVAYDRVSEQAADVLLKVNVRNDEATAFRGKVCYELYNSEGKLISKAQNKLMVSAATASTTTNRIHLRTPHLWTPDTPYLYQLHVLIKNAKGQVVDGYRRRIGVRSFEFKGAKGFFLNGKHYNEPLIGANRHQDFAIVGNALSNSMHWRDAKKLRLAGMRVIRNAHYPQDPAFMDACDELGLFVIVNTPGWQYWNDAPVFQQRVFDDIRGMVRRDRNHPCVWLWEPILNETWYPADFAKTVKKIVMEEYPYSSCYTSSDATARGNELFPILFTHPITGEKEWAEAKRRDSVTYFTREFGDNVDNWNSHNSPSRVNRAWGEVPMLVQAKGYAKPDYEYTCLDALYRTFAHSPQHIGGCLWHSFDHQRGYHPDPFYGGVMDAFRQTKYSYYMFQAQRPASQPMIYIAHAMTPFSPADVTVYSNCDEVRLTVFENGKQYHYTKDKTRIGMPSPIITFSGVYNVMNDKALCRQGKEAQVYLLAEGMMNGKVVASHKVYPARRPSKLLLWADNEGTELFADGSDIVTVVAAVADDHGNIKRLNNYTVKFQIEGEGTLLGDASIGANPRAVQWGTAPVLVKTTTTPGKIRIRASVLLDGKNMPADAMLELETKAPAIPLLYNSTDLPIVTQPFPFATPTTPKSASTHSLKEVEKQQEAFGEQR